METTPQSSLTWIELVLLAILVLSGLAIWHVASRIVDKELQEEAPLRGAFDTSVSLTDAKEKLARTERESKQVRERWSKERLKVLEESHRIEELQAVNSVRGADKVAEAIKVVPSTLQKAKSQLASRERLLVRLGTHLEILSKQEQENRLAIAMAERKAAAEEKRVRKAYKQKKLYKVLAYTSVGTLVLLLVAWIMIRVAEWGRRAVRTGWLFGGTIAVLILILGQVIFGLAPMILAAAFILIPFLVLMGAGRIT